MAAAAAYLVVDALCGSELSPLYWHAYALADAASLAAAVGDPGVLRYAQERLSSQPEFTGALGRDTRHAEVHSLYGDEPPAGTPSTASGHSALLSILSGETVRRLLRRKFHAPERWYDFIMKVGDDDPPAVRQLARAYAASLPKHDTSRLMWRLREWHIREVRPAAEAFPGVLSERAVAKAVDLLHREQWCGAQELRGALEFMNTDQLRAQVEVMTDHLYELFEFGLCWEDFAEADPGLEARTTPLEGDAWDRCRAATHLVCAPGCELATAAWLLGLRSLSEVTADAVAVLQSRIAGFVEDGWLLQEYADVATPRLGDAEVCKEVAMVLQTPDEYAVWGMEVVLEGWGWNGDGAMPYTLNVTDCSLGEHRLSDIPGTWWGSLFDDSAWDDPLNRPIREVEPSEVRSTYELLERFQTLATAMKDAKLKVRADSRLCRAFVMEGEGELSSIVETMREMRFFWEETDYGRYVRVLSTWGNKPGSESPEEASETAKLAALHEYQGSAPAPARFASIPQDAKRVAYEDALYAQKLQSDEMVHRQCIASDGSTSDSSCWRANCCSSDDGDGSM